MPKDLYKAVLLSTASVSIIAVLAAQASNLSSSPPPFQEAVKSYKDRKYSQALQQFKKMHELGQCNDLVHYYTGLCYQALSQINSARSEFGSVARSKDPTIRRNAAYAIASLNQWSQHRLYQGNGNNFDRFSNTSAGNLASRGNLANSGPGKDITFDIPMPSGGGG
ncbi:MAG: hypothetical protein K2X27_09660 [Candidatus Obscuribacterales bacterium]|nr:hypothetical protein [Candidatus Obscuribacterales bacterium]